ncbi:MAG TPA: transcriptional regulator [Candidatus Omnitrophica bacterium]|nr:transcriptional regulator [Candidatus Omnitrophota bacterium]
MKFIIAVIQPSKLVEIKQGLCDIGVNLITVLDVLGHGRQKGFSEKYKGARERGNLLKKIQLEIAVDNKDAEPALQVIIKGAKTGEIGDGKIFVLDLKECVRIRTEERGSVAIG